MAYTVLYDADNDLIRIVFSGSADKDDHWHAFTQALQLGQHRSCWKLLVDFRGLLTSTLSDLDAFSLGESIARAPPYLKIAHVLPHHPKASANIRFASTVEANRGKSTGEFESLDLAIAWLRNSP